MRISVVIPCRDARATIGAQLDALARQEWEGEWEVVVVDNGAGEGARGVIEGFADRLPALRVIDAPERRGGAYARNEGARATDGDALIFCDADDVVGAGWLAAMAAALQRHEFCASRFEYELLNPTVSPGRAAHMAQQTGLQTLWYPPWAPHSGGSGMAVRRSAHERIGGFDESLPRLEDTDYCLRMARAGVNLAFVPDAVVHVRLRTTARGRYRQARDWARINCLLYRTHRNESLVATSAWREHAARWWRLARGVPKLRSREGAADWVGRLGSQVGLLEGSLRYGVAPPVRLHGRGTLPVTPSGGMRWLRTVRGRARSTARYLRRRSLGTVYRVHTLEPAVALTFDDGPDPEFTPRVLEILEAHGAKATFFVIGERAVAHPDVIQSIAAAGHVLANHSHTHKSADELAPEDLVSELERCRQVLAPHGMRLFRPPYGRQSEDSYRAVRRAGYEVIGWSGLSGDWQRRDPAWLEQRLVAMSQPGEIILLHDGLWEPEDPSAADRGYMLEGLEAALERLAGHVRFVTLPELMTLGEVERRPWFTRPRRNGEAGKQRAQPTEGAAPIVEGRLKVSVLGSGLAGDESVTHTTTWVRGPLYGSMEDNDIRGFLDGGFRWAWNQPGQVHVRLGRTSWKDERSRVPVFGEHELFRSLQRWADVVLPPGAEVREAALELDVEKGCARALQLCLYEVHRDWNAGEGGVLENNVSVPASGEVWWNEVAAGESAWAKPGAGEPGRAEDGADTGTMPLATARYDPGDRHVRLSSESLARYVERRASRGEPLRFLLKLADADEDVPGSILSLWSANHGDDGNLARRPRLHVTWRSRAVRLSLERDICLELGRSLRLGQLPVETGDYVAVTWEGELGQEVPCLQARVLAAGWEEWREIPSLIRAPGEELELRIVAAHRPVVLGAEFGATVRDTWVTSGPPESQVVTWTFVSPTGRSSEVSARYAGKYIWETVFRPDEIGRWRYYWVHRLTDQPFRSPAGRFDVFADDRAVVLEHLDALASEIEAGRSTASADAMKGWSTRLLRLERAAVALTDPESWAGDEAAAVRSRVSRVRSALWGRDVPEDFPLESHGLVMEEQGRGLLDPYPGWGPGRSKPRPLWRRVARRVRRRLESTRG